MGTQIVEKKHRFRSLSGLLLALALILAPWFERPSHATDFVATASMSVARQDPSTTPLPNGKVLVVGGYKDSTGYLSSAEIYDPTTGTFSPTGSMITARYQHSAALLPNGKVLIVGGVGTAGYLSSAEIYDPGTGTFSPTGSLITARRVHSATLLQNGKLLVVGGRGATGYLSSAELYDPAAGTFSPTGSMIAARGYHSANLLPNGKVLVAGGNGGGPLDSAELYDPAAGTFSPTGSMTTTRSYQSATLLPNGKVLVVGGATLTQALSSAELYDAGTGTFTPTGSTITARFLHSAALLPSGKVLVIGGFDNSSYLSSAELFDPGNGTFSAIGSMAAGRCYHGTTLLPSGKVLVVGGLNAGGYLGSAELVDPAAGTFGATGSIATPRNYQTATLLPGGKVLVVGGYGYTAGNLSSAEIFDPAVGTFSTTGSMAFARCYNNATLLPNGKVLVFGGINNGGYVSSAELFDPASGIFSLTGSMTVGRVYSSATLLSTGKVLITGGHGPSGFLSSAELYDPATGTFSATGSMATTRSQHSAILLPNGKVLVAGGGGDSGILSSAELYDPVSGTFSATGSMAGARSQYSATLLPNGKVLVAGGTSTGSPGFLSAAELYNPATGTFSMTSSMTAIRSYHTATLLANGRVLVAGGLDGDGHLSSAELYDPATATFSSTGNMTAARGFQSATLLLNSKVLFVGGSDNSGYLSNAELYDAGLGFSENRRPLLSSVTINSGTSPSLLATGTGFKSDSEASSGSYSSSATNYPLFQLQRVDNDQTAFILSSPTISWSDTSFRSASIYGMPGGWYRARVFSNAIPSQEQLILIAPAISISPSSFDFGSVYLGTSSSSQTFTLSNNGSADLIIASATASGGDFSVGSDTCGTFPTTLAPGGSCTITATFTPSSSGALGANLTIVSNAPTTAVTNLSGTGVSPTFLLTVAFNGSGSGTLSGTTNGTPATVSFSANGSTSISNGAQVALNPSPINSTFSSWIGCDSVTGNTCNVTMSSAKSITANFAINTFTLTYTAGANGTITGTSPQTVNYNASGTQITAVPDTGYHFVSWSDGITTATRTDSNVTANASVTANFAINTYTLTYTAGANGTVSSTTPQTVNYNTSGSQVTAVPNTGYHFVSWSDGITTTARTDANVIASASITATFAINTYTVTYTAGANGTVSGTTPQTVNYNASGTQITAVPNTGYHFVSWSDGITTAARTDLNVTATASITATFAINTYTLTYAAGTNGTITGTTPQTVNYNASGTQITAVPNTGYHFVSWSDGITSAARTDANVTATASVTANFAINTYTLTYTAGANGTVSGTTPQTVNYNASGTQVTAVPNTGYHFVSWSDGVTTAERTDANVIASASVTATFAINTYTVTYTAGANGTVSGTTPQTVNYNASGTQVTAVPNTGYHFVSWSDGVTTAARTDANVIANGSVTANFAINSFTLTYNASANGTISGTNFQTVNYSGSGAQVTAVANPGYHFVSWSDGLTTATRADANVAANVSVTATFAVNSYTLTYNAGANGTISGANLQIVNYGGSGTQVTAVANSGYHFVSWSDGKTTAARTDGNIAADLPVSASFAILDGVVIPSAGKTAPDLADALRVQKIALGQIIPTTTDLAHADIAPLGTNNRPKGDGVIDTYDVIGILRMMVGLL